MRNSPRFAPFLVLLLATPFAAFADPHDYEYGTMAYYNETQRQASFQHEIANYSRISPPKPIDLTPAAPRIPAGTPTAEQLARERQFQDSQIAIAHQILNSPTDTRSPFQSTLDAANSGNAVACWNLFQDFLYAREGQSRDVPRAISWLERSATLGNAIAQRWFAFYWQNAYPDDFGAHAPDLAQAARWFRASATAGDPEAAYQLATALREGAGVTADPLEARHWFQVAAQGGRLGAREHYVELLLATGAPADRAAAIAEIRRTIAGRFGSYPTFCTLLAQLLLAEPDGARLHHDELVPLIDQARPPHINDSTPYFAQLLDSDALGQRQPADAVALYEALARQPDDYLDTIDARIRLSDHLATGDGTPRDLPRAAALLQTVPAPFLVRDGHAALRLAYFLRDGVGVDEDPAQAFALFNQVARDEHQPADLRATAASESLATLVTHPDFKPAGVDLHELTLAAAKSAPEVYVRAALQSAQRANRSLDGRRDLHEALDYAERGVREAGLPACRNLAAEYLWEMNERPDDAIAYTRLAADAGFAHAWTILGDVYAQGRGDIEQDFAKALECYQKGLAGGDVCAKGLIANLKADGNGTPPDPAGALRLWREAAPYDLTAAFNLGHSLIDGEFGEKNEAEGAHWLKRSADGGDWIACVAYAEAARRGTGIPKDFAEERRYIARAGEVGDTYAWKRLGILLLQGDIIDADVPAARFWLEKASVGGSHDVNGILCRLYREGAFGPPDFATARRYAEAASPRDDNATVELALLDLQTKPHDLEAAKAAVFTLEHFDTQDPEVREVLADCYERGWGADQDEETAARLRAEAKELRAAFAAPSAIYAFQ